MDIDHPQWTTTPDKPTIANIPSAILLQNGFVFFAASGVLLDGYRPPSMGDYPRRTQNRKHSICHFNSKWLRIFAASGVLLDGYPLPPMGHYPRRTHNRKHSTCHFILKWLRFFAALGATFYWISTSLHGRLPPTNPQSQTFHLPFYFEMASFFRRFGSHFLMDIDHPQWAATPDKPAIANISSAILPQKMDSYFCSLWGPFGSISTFLNGRVPQTNLPSQTFHQPVDFKMASYFCSLWGHFGWIPTTVNGRLPQTNPPSQTFHQPVYFKMASYFCSLWGHFLMDTDDPQWTTTPDKPTIATIPSASLL